MAENLLQKRGRRNRKDSHSIYRRAKNCARFQPLYGRSTAILRDTVPFRVNVAAVARPYCSSLTVVVLWSNGFNTATVDTFYGRSTN